MAKATAPRTTKTSSSSRSNTALQGFAGASSGTLLVLLANNLPDNLPIKSWLVIIAPTVSIVLAWVARRIDIYLKRQRAEAIKKQFIEQIEKALQSPHASEQDKEKLRKMRMEIEMAHIETLFDKFNEINVATIGA